MKIITYNVNGIRAALRKDWLIWLEQENPDIVCLQEIKASPDQLPLEVALIENLGYKHYWYPAQKKGYSGTAIFTKMAPNGIVYGCEHELFDYEGRVIRADFDQFSVISAYFPSGTTGDLRQTVKYEFLDYFYAYVEKLKKNNPNLIICGDYNICHRAIDIHNPKSNANSSGFLPEERAWMEKFLQSGFIDSFRFLNPDPHHYSWWSYRANAREKNLGWRIDYNLVSQALEKNIQEAKILPQAIHSDHCPVVLKLAF